MLEKPQEDEIEYLGSGARVVDAGGDEHAAAAIDDQSSVVVGDVEGLEELGGNRGELNCETQKQASEMKHSSLRQPRRERERERVSLSVVSE